MSSERVKIGSLTPRSRGVNIVAKVVEKPPEKTVSSQYDQSSHRLAEALIADETGAINLVLWDDNIDKVNEGDTIAVNNGYVKVFKGRMQLNIGKYGTLEVVEESIDEVNTSNNLSMQQYYERSSYSGRGRGFGRQRSGTFL